MAVRKPKLTPQIDIWRHAIARAGVGVWDWNLRTDQCAYSASWFEMLGYRENELPQESDLWLKLTHPDDREGAISSGERHLLGDTDKIETELRLRHKDGRWIWVLDRGGIIERDSAGRPVRMVGIQTDITQQKAAESEVLQVNERFRLALEASDIGIWQFDLDTEKIFWDNRTRAIAGLEAGSQALPREVWHQLLHPEDKGEIERAHAAPDAANETMKLRYRMVRPDGSTRYVETLSKLVPVPGTSGRLTGTIRDVTDEHERQQQLAWAARHDPLTGLLNRAAFEQVLEARIVDAGTVPLVLFYIDLDYFKALNDFAGHAAGDVALKTIAQNLRNVLPTAIVARLGGDEFAVLLDLADIDPEFIAENILTSVHCIGSEVSSFQAQLGASIGIAVIREPQTTVAEALARADDACYGAKSGGRNRWFTFSQSQALSSGLTAARLVADLVDAKLEGRLMLFGQEIRELDTAFEPSGRIEVLARLVSKEGKFISPGEFISAAERFGAAPSLDRWIVQTAMRNFGSRLGGPKNITLSFNLSAQTLSDPALWDYVESARVGAGAHCSNISFEITETAAFTNMKAAEWFVRKARSKGYRVTLDDFGAGLSSFSYLRRFPVDGVKIDGSFIENLRTSRFDREVVRSISAVAASLGYQVVAEKIEDAETLGILQDLGIAMGQGFLMHKPEPLEHLFKEQDASSESYARAGGSMPCPSSPSALSGSKPARDRQESVS